MKKTKHSRIMIIGSGPAGYTAGVYAARALLDPILIQGVQPGGQLTITTDVENWPGLCEVQGPYLMEQMAAHARNAGTELINDHIKRLDLSSKPFVAIADSGKSYSSDSVILATGAQAKWLGLPSEDYYKGFGVSACATCDGFFFRGSDIVVVGGGNTAVEEALFLTKFASSVTLIHRRDTLRAEKIMQKRLFNNPKIKILWDSEIIEVFGDSDPKSVKGVKIKNLKSDKISSLECSGVFIAIGHSPASELVIGQLELREGGYVVTKADSTETSMRGVFAAGDLTDDKYRQAVTSAGMGCMAALEAEKYLAELD
ncbi:MAG: thioredoxin-disulfide reductase [Pseudomonadota bacterium]|nr:thioredoxin-disulfide reductase [Pseudomonadota bacterium]